MHSGSAQHHHQAHMQMSLVTSVAAYAQHPHHHPSFHPNPQIHHPQPLPFGPMVHHSHPLIPPPRLEHKLSAFEMPNHNSEFYKNGHIPQPSLSLHPLPQPQNNNHLHHFHQSPSPTQTIKSNPSTVEPSNDRSSASSPQLVVDGVASPISISSNSNNNTINHNNNNNNSSTTVNNNPVSNNTNGRLNGVSQHNGLLDILMNPDKCQELIQYHNSMMFQPLPGSAFELRVPTWEVLQETTARLLFMAVRWVRCLVPFQTLSKNDQQLLLQVSDFKLRASAAGVAQTKICV